MSGNGPPFNGDKFKRFAWEFDFMHITSSLHFHWSNGFIKGKVKKVKNTYKKTDGSPNAQVRALLQLRDTPILTDLPSPMEILHRWPAQGAVISRPPKWINIHQICKRLIKIQNTQKEQFDRAHRAKDLWVLKVNKQVQFFPNKQGTGSLTWLTGTVTEILDCGHLYIIQGPNGRVYRRNRAHLKPICYNGTSFQDHPAKKEEKKPEINSFQDPKPIKVKTVSFPTDTSYMDARSMFYDEPNTHRTHPSSPSLSPQWLYSPRSPSYSPPASRSSRESLVQLHSRGLFTYRWEETSVWTSLHKTPWYWQRNHTKTFTGNVNPSTIQTGEICQSKSQTGFSTMRWTPFKTLWRKIGNWCKLTHFKTLTHTAKLTPFKTLFSYVAHNPFILTSFKTLCLYTAQNCSNWLLSRPLHWITTVFSFSMGDTLQFDSVKSPWILPSTKLVLSEPFHTVNPGLISRPLHCIKQCFHSPWETSFKQINSFRTILHSEFQIPFKTPVTYMSHLVNGLLFKTIWKRKRMQSTLQ